MCLDRVTIENGSPVRLYPFSRDPAPNAPRAVLMDPAFRFGQPILAGRGLPTSALGDRFRGGEPIADLVADYRLRQEEVEEAIRYEARFPPPLTQTRPCVA